MQLEKVHFKNYKMEKIPKQQIYLHHTVSNPKQNAKDIINYWKSLNNYVNTVFIIDKNGSIIQLYNEEYWSWHLGLKVQDFKNFNVKYTNLNALSIGIELVNSGPVEYRNKKFYPNSFKTNSEITEENVVVYDRPFKKQIMYEAYSKEQINSLNLLLTSLTNTYNIPDNYNESIWDLDVNAFKGVPGIYTHNSVRLDKSDVHPDPNLILMLKNLKPKPIIIPPKPVVFTDKHDKHVKLVNFLTELGWNKKIYNDN